MNEQSSQTSGISQQILGKLLAKARVPTDSEVWYGVKSAGPDRGLEGKLPSLGAAAASLPQTLRLASGVERCLACERVRRRLGGCRHERKCLFGLCYPGVGSESRAPKRCRLLPLPARVLVFGGLREMSLLETEGGGCAVSLCGISHSRPVVAGCPGVVCQCSTGSHGAFVPS